MENRWRPSWTMESLSGFLEGDDFVVKACSIDSNKIDSAFIPTTVIL